MSRKIRVRVKTEEVLALRASLESAQQEVETLRRALEASRSLADTYYKRMMNYEHVLRSGAVPYITKDHNGVEHVNYTVVSRA
jgi:hypothetical protein